MFQAHLQIYHKTNLRIHVSLILPCAEGRTHSPRGMRATTLLPGGHSMWPPVAQVKLKLLCQDDIQQGD